MRYRHQGESSWNLVPFEFSNASVSWKPGTPAPFQWAGAANSPQLVEVFLNLETEEEGVLRIGDDGWRVRASFPGRDEPEREAALRAFHERYDRDGKDRLDPWLRDAVVAHLVLVRDLR